MNSSSSKTPWVIVAGGFHRAGGMDKANLALAEHLLDQNIPVHIVTHQVDSELNQHPLAKVHLVKRPAGLFALGEPLLDREGRRVARSVVSQWPQAPVVINGGNCIWPGINWAHYVHHAWRPTVSDGPLGHRIKNDLFSAWARKRERAAFLQARLVITNSHCTTQHVMEHFHVDEQKVHTVYLGTDPQWGPASEEERRAARLKLGVAESRPLAVFVGALGLDHRKGFDVLFEAWRRVCSRPDWDVDLAVAGDGKALKMWQAKVSEAKLSERIRFLGFSDQVKTLLAAADLLISPVRYEAYGLNVQEAICRGVPALVAASAGAAEHYSADLFPLLLPDPEDVSDLAARLLNWRAGIDSWKEQFRALGQELRRNTWPKMAETMVSLVDNLSQAEQRNAVVTLPR